MKELCQEWDKKKDADKKFADFYKAVHAVAFSTGTKLKTRVQVLNKVKLLSILYMAQQCVLGEEEKQYNSKN